MNSHPSICAIVPCYNHSRTVPMIVRSLRQLDIPVIVIEDGSGNEAASLLRYELKDIPRTEIVTHEFNRGKGAAVETGLRLAREHGYTHALQIDADGQHDVGQVPAMRDCSRKNPRALVLGRPIFDSSLPMIRKWGRKLSVAMVALETLSLRIGDPLCGFRIYPIADTIAALEESSTNMGMGFDPEILVRLFWRGIPVIHVPVKVIYPHDGISNFKMWRDNISMLCLHLRLLMQMPLAQIQRLTG